MSATDTRSQAQPKPPSIGSSRIGVRRLYIDVGPGTPEQKSLTESPEVELFCLVWRPRRVVETPDGRVVWELRALREAGS